MYIPVKVTSNSTGRIRSGVVSPRQLLDFIDESDIIIYLTKCGCQPVGETNVVDCNCDDEWEDCEVVIGEEAE